MHAPQSIVELEDRLSEPSATLVESFRALRGTLLLLGVGGKMGPSTARMAQRAAREAGSPVRVVGVSRFRQGEIRAQLEQHGVATLAGDLHDPEFVDRVPDADYVVSLVGAKFGTQHRPDITWATNTYLAGLIAYRFRRSRVTALSTGNVYGLVNVAGNSGSTERDSLHPVGEYAQSAVGRERVYDFLSRRYEIPMSIIRLNYATEMRYGVLVDLAAQVKSGKPVSLEIPAFNVIWQRDASDWVLQSLLHAETPPNYLNITGREILSSRTIGEKFAALFNMSVDFSGPPGTKALLSDPSEAYRLFGEPSVATDQLVEWTADWIGRDQPRWDKPTNYERADGKF